MFSTIRLPCIFLLLLLGVTLRAQTTFSIVVVFGDSLSDTGNIAHITQNQYLIRFPADNTLLGIDYIATTPAPDAQTLYIVWGGADDLYADDSAANVTAAAQRETALIQRLVTAGATNFLVPNLPPLGNAPEYAANAVALNAALASFAAQLAQDLAGLKISVAAQGVTINIYQPDIYTLFNNAVTTPTSFALGNVTAAAQNITSNPDTSSSGMAFIRPQRAITSCRLPQPTCLLRSLPVQTL